MGHAYRIWALSVVLSLVVAPARGVVSQATEEESTAWPPPGLEDTVGRSYTASGFRFIGSLAFIFVVARFDSPEHASGAGPVMVDTYLAQVVGDTSGIRRASVRQLGDEAVGYAGEFVSFEEDVPDSLTLAILVVREGNLVHFMIGVAIVGDPLLDLIEIADRVMGRTQGGPGTSVDRDGMHSGGLWDLLPRLEDMPEGFVFDEDQLPEALVGQIEDREFAGNPLPVTPTPREVACATPQVILSTRCGAITLSGESRGETEEFFLRPGDVYFTVVYPNTAQIAVYLLSPFEEEPILIFEGEGPFDAFFMKTIEQFGRYTLQVEAQGKWTITIEQ